MIFTITSINKNLDLYEVVSSDNSKMMVSSFQITNVLAQGYEFTNAYLTKKGFAIKTPSGTRYVQLPNMPRELEIAVLNRLKYIKDMEEAKKQQMSEAIKKPTAMAKKPVAKVGGVRKITQGNRNPERIVYKGDVYFTHAQLCKKYNRDLATFEELYKKGYSIEESLGFMPLRPESELTPRANIEKLMDRMDAQRGGF